MRASRRNCPYASFVLPAVLLLGTRTHAEKLIIASTPSGATLEIDVAVVGTTPYEIAYPNGYFHKTHTVFGTRLEHAMLLRIYMEGFAPQKVALTSGPFEWVAVTGRHHGKYFLLKSQRFDITLDPVSRSGEETMEAGMGARAGPIHPHQAASAFQNASAAASDSGTVEIESDPPATDIYVDWKFVGQTPSTLRLAGGPHHIELKSRGRQTWERELQIANGSGITLRPVLELLPVSPPDH
jgi:hypothetical protein